MKRLSAEGFRWLIAVIRGLADNPRPSGCRKIAGSRRDWRVRVGSYRVIYEIDDKSQLVKVMRVRRRREVYR
ncbi:MAG: type II toxin-antitoxin system RelE/ParE family toxin [candidate division NC10 bacterium]|nr:type II toxin-antitoxin system RelE/ParE family toxin [candidate division NC10 bacterium]